MSVIEQLEEHIWEKRKPNRTTHILRILVTVFRTVTKSRIKLFATSLTYHSLLAMVPLLAVLFMLLKSFGVERFLKQMIGELLAPMGESGKQVGDYLFQFIGNAQAGFLGGIGLLFLFYSIFKLFNKIEEALNHLWHIDRRRQLKDQLLGYLGIIVLIVVVAIVALGLNVVIHKDIVENHWGDTPLLGSLLTLAIKSLSVMFTALLLAVIYNGAINFDCKFRAVFLGGLFCALLWLPLTAGFAKLISASTSYSVIYSGFAGLVVLLIWLNILWVLFLSGALVAYFVQFPGLLQRHSSQTLNPTEIEYYANQLIGYIVESFNKGSGPVTLSSLMGHGHLGHRQVIQLLKPFLKRGMIICVGKSQDRYLLAVPPEQVTNATITRIIRGKKR